MNYGLTKMKWVVAERPGYFGTSRDEIHKGYDTKYGQGNWRIAWTWGSLVLERPEALQLYEDGYYEFLKSNPKLLEDLIIMALDVYDTAPSNVEARFSYDHQETESNHIHDVAIRRAVLRNGVWFMGKNLVHVRPGKEGEKFGPHLIPFHLPSMIFSGETMYKDKPRDFSKDPPWWRNLGIPFSIEEFYQQNKVLLVKE